MHNLTKIKVFRVLLYATYPLAVLLLPFALLKKKNTGRFFFFFDRYSIGGAQRVHLDILKSIEDQQKQIYFTRSSPDNALEKVFFSLPNAKVKDIHFYCDNLLIRLFTVHFYAFYINRHAKPIVFSSNSTFFYDMLPFIKRKAIKAELLHNFTYGKNGMEFFGLANHQYLDHRMVIDNATKQNILGQYTEYRIPERYRDSIRTIEPGVFIPPNIQKDFSLPLNILYAGRGGTQKRIYLLNAIAEHCLENGLPVQFHFAGTLMDELSALVIEQSIIHGKISDPEEMQALYQKAHLILMTSAYEGFPMLIKEGMANGCVPLVTALDGNKTHLHHMDNALLISDPENEDHVVADGYVQIKELLNDGERLKHLSEKAYAYAHMHFNRDNFVSAYRTFFKNILK